MTVRPRKPAIFSPDDPNVIVTAAKDDPLIDMIREDQARLSLERDHLARGHVAECLFRQLNRCHGLTCPPRGRRARSEHPPHVLHAGVRLVDDLGTPLCGLVGFLPLAAHEMRERKRDLRQRQRHVAAAHRRCAGRDGRRAHGADDGIQAGLFAGFHERAWMEGDQANAQRGRALDLILERQIRFLPEGCIGRGDVDQIGSMNGNRAQVRMGHRRILESGDVLLGERFRRPLAVALGEDQKRIASRLARALEGVVWPAGRADMSA